MSTVRFSLWVEVPDLADFDHAEFHNLLSEAVPGYIEHEWEDSYDD